MFSSNYKRILIVASMFLVVRGNEFFFKCNKNSATIVILTKKSKKIDFLFFFQFEDSVWVSIYAPQQIIVMSYFTNPRK